MFLVVEHWILIKLTNCVQIPTAGVWFEVSNKAYSFFLSSDQSLDKDLNKNKLQQQQQLLSSLRSLLDTDVRFSEGRCGKVLPLATATYQENLPPQYTRDYHESKVTNDVYIPSSVSVCIFSEDYMKYLESQAVTKESKKKYKKDLY